jgi:hypothetical protein
MRIRIALLALILAISALVVAGCGDDEDEPTTSAETALTEEEFLAQGNEICAAGNDELDQLASETFAGQQPTPSEIEKFAELFIENIQSQIDAIRTLPAPESLAADVDTFLSDAEAVLADIEADPSLLAVSENDSPFADINVQATEIGLTECG